MYFVKYVSGTQRHIIDRDQQTVFIGTKQQVEDWLDLQENARRLAAPSPVSFGRIARAVITHCVRILRGFSSLVRGSRADSRS
ncbi:MAG: hypothetical protein ACM3U2_20345, partial [Deltaproteobacteria bacterium]